MIGPITAAALAAAITMTPGVTPAKEVKPCRDRIVQAITDAGWKGRHVRVAYGVAWRESNLNPTTISPSDDWGLFQLNRPTWEGTPYWPADPLNARSNAKAAHKLWKVTSWRPWGLNSTGTGVDMRDYNWSDWQISNWVWQPYVEGLRRFDRLPRECRRA